MGVRSADVQNWEAAGRRWPGSSLGRPRSTGTACAEKQQRLKPRGHRRRPIRNSPALPRTGTPADRQEWLVDHRHRQLIDCWAPQPPRMADKNEDDKPIKTLTAEDIRLLKTVRDRPVDAVLQPARPLPGSQGAYSRHQGPVPPARRPAACSDRHPPPPATAAARPTPEAALLIPPSLPPPVVQYGAGPYSSKIKKLEGDIKEIAKKVNEVSGVKESDTGLAHPSRWDLVSDKQAQQEEHPLQVRGRGG